MDVKSHQFNPKSPLLLLEFPRLPLYFQLNLELLYTGLNHSLSFNHSSISLLVPSRINPILSKNVEKLSGSYSVSRITPTQFD